MARQSYAVQVEDVASGEAASFHVVASSKLIACTRAASRLFGPEAEARLVYACAACGEELWEGERRDSSGVRLCARCSSDEVSVLAEGEPIGLAVGRTRITATPLAPLPGDAPTGLLEVVVEDPGGRLARSDALDADEAREALERAVRAEGTAERLLGQATVRDESGAFFCFELQAVPAPVDAHDLAARGLIKETEAEDEIDIDPGRDEYSEEPEGEREDGG